MVDEAVEFSREWLDKAGHDRLTAETLVAHAPQLTDTISFHCQQAVEKTLKAFLTYHGRVFEKTHDLDRLCVLCAGVDSSFARLGARAGNLNDYAVGFRYPGSESPTLKEVQEALDVVREVWAFVLERLPDSLRKAYQRT